MLDTETPSSKVSFSDILKDAYCVFNRVKAVTGKRNHL